MIESSSIGTALAVVSLTAGAAVLDVRTRRIPNQLTGPALIAGLLAHAIVSGPPGLRDSLYGVLAAGGLLLPGWLLGWTGAGDVKLMAAVGAWLAFPLGLLAALASLIAGGVLALITAARHGVLGRSLVNTAMIGAWTASGLRRGGAQPVTTGIRFPFGVAILAGTIAVLWRLP
jgi:prepilin peptidase CpaA